MVTMIHDHEINLPAGCIFTPKDEDLLEYYLKPKVYGQKLPCNIVEEKKIYGPRANPWRVFDASSTQWISSGKFEKTVYVFTRITKETVLLKTEKKKLCGVGREQCVKKAGCGTWHGGIGRKVIKKGDNVIGFKRLMVFEINDISSLGDGVDLDGVGYWKMHEYCLYGNEGNGDFVLCQITLDTSKNAKVVGLCRNTEPKDDTEIVTTDDGAEVDFGSEHEDYIVQEPVKGDQKFNNDHKCQIKLDGITTDCDLPVSTMYSSNIFGGDDLINQENMNKGKLENIDNWSNPIVEEQVYDRGCLAGMIGFWTWMISLKIF